MILERHYGTGGSGKLQHLRVLGLCLQPESGVADDGRFRSNFAVRVGVKSPSVGLLQIR